MEVIKNVKESGACLPLLSNELDKVVCSQSAWWLE